MTVKEAAENTVCSAYNAAVFRRISVEHDETTFSGWMKNRKIIRFIWESTDDDECPPLDEEIANAEIEDNFSIMPTGDYAFTLK